LALKTILIASTYTMIILRNVATITSGFVYVFSDLCLNVYFFVIYFAENEIFAKKTVTFGYYYFL